MTPSVDASGVRGDEGLKELPRLPEVAGFEEIGRVADRVVVPVVLVDTGEHLLHLEVRSGSGVDDGAKEGWDLGAGLTPVLVAGFHEPYGVSDNGRPGTRTPVASFVYSHRTGTAAEGDGSGSAPAQRRYASISCTVGPGIDPVGTTSSSEMR